MSIPFQTLQNAITSQTVERKNNDASIVEQMNQLTLNVRVGVGVGVGAAVVGAVIADALTESPAERKARETREREQREQENREREKLAKQLLETEKEVKLLLSAKGGDPNSFALNRSLNPSMNELRDLLAQAAKEKEALNKG